MTRTGSRIRRPAAAITLPAALAILAGCTQASFPAHAVVAQTPPVSPDAPSAAPVLTQAPASAPEPTAQAGTSPTPGYSRYYNRRFQFSFDVPDGYTEQAPPEDGDGDGFTNGVATITGFGQDYLESARTPKQDLAELVSNYRSSGGTVTYQSADGDIAAVSGITSQGQIFYQRDVVFPTVVYSLEWSYPYADKTQYDPLVDHTAHTFAPGPDHTG